MLVKLSYRYCNPSRNFVSAWEQILRITPDVIVVIILIVVQYLHIFNKQSKSVKFTKINYFKDEFINLFIDVSKKFIFIGFDK